jgi:hypothetical protein
VKLEAFEEQIQGFDQGRDGDETHVAEVMAQPPKTVPLRRVLSGRLLSEYIGKPINHEDTLLGDRYLCRGGGMFAVAPSGVGKSVFSIQCAVNWSVGRKAFGIKPARPLRILIIQAEDDEGDIIEMSNLATKLGLNKEETALFNSNVWIEHVNDLTGVNFTIALDGFLEQWPADIVIINPYSSYLGKDVKDDGHANMFLRNWLNPVLTKHRCAALFIHHTPKTQFQNTDDWKPSDWMYRGAGAAALTNWSRAYLVIDPTTTHGCYKFIAAKRGRRIGWNGAFHLHFSHSQNDGELLWVPSSEDEIRASESKSKLTAKDLLPFIPSKDEGSISIPDIIKAAKGTLGEKYVRKFIKELVDLDKITCHHVKNQQNKPIEEYAQK